MPSCQEKEQLSFSGTERASREDWQIRVCYKNPTNGHLCSFEIWQKQEKETRIRFKYLWIPSQPWHTLALTFGKLSNILLSGFSSQRHGWWQKLQGSFYTYNENKGLCKV